MRYRKKPIVVDADKWEPKNQNARDLAKLHGWNIDSQGNVLISTLEGFMNCNPGDWIIRGVEGEYYSCKPSVFQKTYEKADE
jgi:hypothetical protein